MNRQRFIPRVTSLVVVSLCVVFSAFAASAQTPSSPAALTVKATGTFPRGGWFTGLITINKFEERNGHIVASGFVSGTVGRGFGPLGTAVAGPVTWPVTVRSGSVSLARRDAPSAKMQDALWTSSMARRYDYVFAQATTCDALNVMLGATTVNLMGVSVALDPVSLNLTGVVGTPLGDLVCSAEDLIGNVAGIVNLLNSILGLLLGLLGGLTGGLGGGAPVI